MSVRNPFETGVPRINLHGNARLTFRNRALLMRRTLEEGQRPVEACACPRAHRQRRLLPLRRICHGVPASGPASSRHPALLSAPERQNRTSDPEHTPRMGRCRSCDNADQRAAHLPQWLHEYNWHRPHTRLNCRTPVSKLGASVNNLMLYKIWRTKLKLCKVTSCVKQLDTVARRRTTAEACRRRYAFHRLR